MTEKEKKDLSPKERTIMLFWEYQDRWERRGHPDSIYMLKEGIQTVLEVVFKIDMEEFPSRPDVIKQQTVYG